LNYFNYFTEIENFYQTKRETFTLISSLDWVLIENWKEAGIPLEVVLKALTGPFPRRNAGSIRWHIASELSTKYFTNKKKLESNDRIFLKLRKTKFRRFLRRLRQELRR